MSSRYYGERPELRVRTKYWLLTASYLATVAKSFVFTDRALSRLDGGGTDALARKYLCLPHVGEGRGYRWSKLPAHSRSTIDLFSRSLSLPILLMMASIEKQNGQHSQREEADGKMSHVAQVRTHKDRE
jgi:hypothetical protein